MTTPKKTTPKKTTPKGTSTGTKKTAPAKAKAAEPKDPVTPKTPEKAEPPTMEKIFPKQEPKSKGLPGYLNKSILETKERQELIEDFNKTFDAQFPLKLKTARVLKNMQSRLLRQKYNK